MTTITPEERAQWRDWSKNYPHSGYTGDDEAIARLLDALEAEEAQCNFLAEASQPLANLYQEAEARAEKAEAERDAIARKFSDVSDKMSGHNPPRHICTACDICPEGSDIEMEGVTCEVRVLEWAAATSAQQEVPHGQAKVRS